MLFADILMVIFGNKKQKNYVLSIINPYFLAFFVVYMITLIALFSYVFTYMQRNRLVNLIDKLEPIKYIALRYALY